MPLNCVLTASHRSQVVPLRPVLSLETLGFSPRQWGSILPGYRLLLRQAPDVTGNWQAAGSQKKRQQGTMQCSVESAMWGGVDGGRDRTVNRKKGERQGIERWGNRRGGSWTDMFQWESQRSTVRVRGSTQICSSLLRYPPRHNGARLRLTIVQQEQEVPLCWKLAK